MNPYLQLFTSNGIRSVDLVKINESIPTTLHIKGNKIKIKYPGQGRTAICSFCRERGHYKLKDIIKTLIIVVIYAAPMS